MKGYPKNLNTKEDYEFVRKNFTKEDWKQDFQDILNTQKAWFNSGEIEVGKSGVEDGSHKVVTDEKTGKKYQYEYKDDPDCKMVRIGYTAAEIEEIMK